MRTQWDGRSRNRFLISLLVGCLVLLLSGIAFAQLPADVPRNETLILDQIFRYSVPKNFNIWMTTGGSTPTRQGFCSDTLWYIDQQTGEWINSLAEAEPVYNKEYTEMTVKLRKGIFWSDGVEFTADDIVFTIENLKAHPEMLFGSEFALYVEEVKKTDNYTVVVKLKKPHPRFHYLFTARYNACYIQPKHVWEKVEKPMEYTFYPPVSLGAYVVKDADPNGYWELFQLREDWQRTSVGMVTGKSGPKYILTIFYGPNEKKVIAMTQHQLDLLMDLDYEAFQSLIKKSNTVRSWYKDFPWAWPDEQDGRSFGFNLEKQSVYQEKDVRWALALALDIVELQTEYIGGTARITPIPQPATLFHMKNYHKPLLPWLKELKLEIGPGESFQPFDETVPAKVAEWAKKKGYTVPSEPEKLVDLFGIGWWKYAPDVAEKLLKKHGFKKEQDKWLLPDGTPWKISILATPDEVDVYRLAMGAADQWGRFGIAVEIESLERDPYYIRNIVGDYDCSSAWGMGGGFGASATLDKWPFIYMLHSNFYKPTGERAVGGFGGNRLRVKSPELDKLIDEMGVLSPQDPKVAEMGKEFLKLWTENMWSISTISFKKFVTEDEYYWTNFPSSENPYGQPCYWFMGGRFILPQLQATGQK
jgi:peptide/nickel transport system substrate-binding protein